MIIEKMRIEDFTILYVKGMIKIGESAEFFSSSLENALTTETTNLIIDFTKIDYMDSTVVGILVAYLGKFSDRNRKLALVNPSERIVRLLSLAGLDVLFRIYKTEGEAVSAERGDHHRA